MATIKYVDASAGSDSNQGTSASPWKTLAASFAKLQPGWELRVRGTSATPYQESNLSVTANNVTVTADSGHTPLVNGGVPKNNEWYAAMKASGKPTYNTPYTPIIQIYSSGVTLSNISFTEGHRGIYIAGPDVTVDGCKTSYMNRHGLIGTSSATGLTVQNCTIDWSSRVKLSPSITASGSDDVLFQKNLVTNGQNEGMSFQGCTNSRMSKNTLINIRRVSYYLDSSSDCIVDNNIVYCTNLSDPSNGGIVLNNEVYRDSSGKAGVLENIDIYNNLVVQCGRGFWIKAGKDGGSVGDSGGGENPDAGFRGIRVINNTFVNQVNTALWWRDESWTKASSHTTCWFVNNIVLQDNEDMAWFRANSSVSKWIFANNISNVAINKANSTYISGTLASGHVVDATEALTNYDAVLTRPAHFDIENYKILTGSSANGGGTASYSPPTLDFFGSTRATPPDMGFHEYGGTQSSNALTAAFTASTSTPSVGSTTVTFSDATTPAGNATVERVLWELDGATYASGFSNTSTAPQVVYNSVGAFRVKYTVYDDTYTIANAVETERAIVVSPAAGDAPLETVVVSGDALDATVAHGMSSPPVAALVFWNSATTDVDIDAMTNVVSGAEQSHGIWAQGNSGQYVHSIYEPNGQDARIGKTGNFSGYIIHGQNGNMRAAISSVDATNVNLSWTGTGSGKFTMVLFGGSGVASNAVYMHSLTGTTPLEQSGNYNLLIFPGVHGSIDSLRFHSAINLGFAVRDVGQGCAAWGMHRTKNGAAAIWDNKVADATKESEDFTIAFSSSSYTVTGADGGNLPTLALRLEGVSMDVAVIDMPTSATAKDYTLAFDPGLIIAGLLGVTSSGAGSGVSAGTFAVHASDGTTQRSHGIHANNETISSSNPTVTGSYTDAGVALTDHEAAVGDYMQGASTLTTAKYQMTMDAGKFSASARKAVVLAVEGSSTAQLTAHAYYTGDNLQDDGTYLIYAGETLNFYSDASQTDGIATAFTTYDWDWGDGTSNGTTASTTHAFASPGTYVITFTLTDALAATSTYEITVDVLPAEPSVAYTIDTVSGTVTFVATLTPVVTAGSGSTLEQVEWRLLPNRDTDTDIFGEIDPDATPTAVSTGGGWQPAQPTDRVINLTSAYYNPAPTYSPQIGTGTADAVFSISVPGVYSIGLTVRYTDGNYYQYTYEDQIEALGDDDAPGVLAITYDTAGIGRSFVGPKTVVFGLTIDGVAVTTADIESVSWDLDGDALADDTAVAPSFVYSAGAASYDIEATVTRQGGDVEVLSISDFIHIVAASTTPPILSVLYAALLVVYNLWDTLRPHLGFIEPGEWTQAASPNLNVYSFAYTMPWFTGVTLALFEDGTRLSTQVSVAACQANAGSYYISGGTVYVHPTYSDSPIYNGYEYKLGRAS